jgi:hypothetical protein
MFRLSDLHSRLLEGMVSCYVGLRRLRSTLALAGVGIVAPVLSGCSSAALAPATATSVASTATSTSAVANQSPSASPSLSLRPSAVLKLRPEREEFGAPSFADYLTFAGGGQRIPAGQVVRVYCRVPGTAATPSSIGRGGWYKIRLADGRAAYVAANTFFNDLGNGYGEATNNNAFDPAVPKC